MKETHKNVTIKTQKIQWKSY